MKTFLTLAAAAAAGMTMTIASAQSGGVMHDGGWMTAWAGASGAVWPPLLLIVVLGGLVAWVVQRERN